MRGIVDPRLERGRIREGELASDPAWGLHGAFFVMGPCGERLAVLAADGIDPEAKGWEHVSVSCKHRIPNWTEMCFVKNLFWREDETVLQFHPKQSEYINCHPNVLHLWRKVGEDYELPPAELIGPKGKSAA